MIKKETIKHLIQEAKKASTLAYAPYSSLGVGAAILCANKEIFIGANIENASYGLSMCAERVAALSAIMSGNRDWVALAIVFDKKPAQPPCGACCQFLAEFCSDNLLILWGDGKNSYNNSSLGKLITRPFRHKHT